MKITKAKNLERVHTHREEFEKEKGITLIALVITIIILLLLAGITISTLTGKNKLLNKVANSKIESDKAKEKEQINIALMAARTNEEANIDKQVLAGELSKIEGMREVPKESEANEKSFPWLVLGKTGTEYMIDDKGFTVKSSNEDKYNDLKQILEKLKLDVNTSSVDIINNKDGILDIALKDRDFINYIIKNFDEYKEILNSENGVDKLSKSEYASYKVIMSKDWRKAILESEFANKFDQNAKQVPSLTSNNDNIIYPKNEFALTGKEYMAFDRNISADIIEESYNTAQLFNYTYDAKNEHVYSYKGDNYLGYNFEKEMICYKFIYIGICTSNPLGYGTTPKNYRIEGTNDGNNWETIYTGLNTITHTSGFRIIEQIETEKAYKMFRMYVQDVNIANQFSGIGYNELQFFCVEKVD